MTSPSPAPTSRGHAASFHLSRTGVLLLTLAVLGPWGALFYWHLNSESVRPAAAAHPGRGSPVAISAADYVSEGAWGRLELSRVIIEPPDDLIAVSVPPRTHAVWHFIGYTTTELAALLDRAKLNDHQIAYLKAPANWKLHDRGIDVAVPKSIVLSLSPESRGILYGALSPFDDNLPQNAPASFRADSPEAWFANSGLSDQTKNLVRPLLYRRAQSLLFSDLEMILSDVESIRQRLLLVRMLARTTTQLAKVRLMPGTDISAIARYWSLGQRTRNIEPLLRSMTIPPEGVSLDVIHLLPPFARRLLYTYPEPPDPGQTAFRDCHWTALNFANDEVDDRYVDIREVKKAYQELYRPVTDEPRLGDIYLFVTQQEVVLHACVHIADDLVFTKNGSWAGSPWILMRLPDLIALYPTETPLDIQHLRRRN